MNSPIKRYVIDTITKPLTKRVNLYTAPPEPVKIEPKKKKVLRYSDWSQADQMRDILNRNSK